MRVEYFFLEAEDAEAGRHIEGVVRDYLGGDVEVVHTRLGADTGPGVFNYVRCLEATIPPSQPISISGHRLSWFERNVYLRVYWPIYVRGYSRNIGESVVQFEGYTFERAVSAYRESGGLKLFLPALAMRDQLVLVPHGQSELFKTIAADFQDRDLDSDISSSRDVTEVDFTDRTGLETAVCGACDWLLEQIRRDVLRDRERIAQRGHAYARAYATYISAVGEEDRMAASAALIERALRDVEDEVTAVYRSLTYWITPERLTVGRWTKATLSIDNRSGQDVVAAQLTLSGPIECLPATLTVDLPAGAVTEVVLSLMPKDEGDFPVALELVAARDHAFRDRLPKAHLWLVAISRPPGAPE